MATNERKFDIKVLIHILSCITELEVVVNRHGSWSIYKYAKFDLLTLRITILEDHEQKVVHFITRLCLQILEKLAMKTILTVDDAIRHAWKL